MDLEIARIKARTICERAVLELEEIKVSLATEFRVLRGCAKSSQIAEAIQDQVHVFEEAIGSIKRARSLILLEPTRNDNAPDPDLSPASHRKVFQLSSFFHFLR